MESTAQRIESTPWSVGPFVGRERELEELDGCARAAAEGRGLLVLLAGEPGIGKTRTAGELSRRAAERGGLETLWGRCHDGEGAPAYWPWVQIIRACVEACDRAAGSDPAPLRALLTAGADDVLQLVPELRDRLPDLAPPPTMEPAQARFRLFDGVTTLLRNAARRQPLLVVLDDLHWADTSSLLLLEFLVRELHRAAILVLGTYRDLEVGPEHTLFNRSGRWSASPRRAGSRSPGSSPATGALRRGRDRHAPADALVSDVAERTGGNPFFAGELVRLLAAQGGSAVAVPDDVHAVVALRLGRLSGACRDLLRLARSSDATSISISSRAPARCPASVSSSCSTRP